MSVSKNVVMSAGDIDSLVSMLNKYFFSESVSIADEKVYNNGRELTSYEMRIKVVKGRKRFQIIIK